MPDNTEIDEETPVDEEEVEPTDEEMQDEFADGDPVPWHGVLAPIGVESGDGRKFASMLTTRDLPIPLKFMREDGERHDRSVVVGNITAVWEDEGLIKAEGFFANTDESAEVISLRAEDMVRGVSVDLDMVEAEFQRVDGSVLAEGDPIPPDTEPVTMVVTKGRIAAATIVAIPAFQEAWFDLGTWDDEQIMQEDAEEEPVAASAEFAPGTKDGPGWITHPKETSRIRRYWTHGKGAAKIKWGAPGDFNRCRTQLAKYIQNPAFLAGTCANMHKEALGFWPGEHHGGETMTASAAPAFTLVDPPEALTAGGYTPPASWFTDPGLTGPTPLTVTEDGHVYGHAATWNECHIGIQNKCVTAPHSLTNYAYFHTGAVRTSEGEVAVGHITMSTGHATLDLAAGPAAEHYDNTGTVVADIRVGEDAHGIWVAGAVRPGLTDDQRYALKAAAISGDWRPIGAGLEMVAALAVNTPGFPVPRPALAASGERMTALVAAAVVEPVATLDEFDMSKVVASGIEEYEARKERKAMRESLSASIKTITTVEDKERDMLRASILNTIGE